MTTPNQPTASDDATTPEPAPITAELITEHGLTDEEYARVLEIMGRTPSITELGIFSVMWSEHCSYKSSKVWLKTLPTEGPQVIQGPGENAGVVDLGDGDCAVFKMESHNHPSFIEPYQGAATGVGGIMRDVFTMGARPVANMNALRFGATDHPRTRHLVAGVVAGIGGYGNCMGVPTIGGETNFDPRYNNNILVNAMCVGLARTDAIFYSAARGVGLPVVYVGSKTGRDGIHGATMASAEFDETSEEKRPTVQVGDPFTEKLLLEACLELMAEDAIIAIQDMGAAGLTSSSVEMADKGGVGFTLNLDQVPQRETAMTAYEMMLSESQERMLMVLKPGTEEKARTIFDKWELAFAVVGETTDSGRLRITHRDALVADMPVATLADSAPEYRRPHTPTAPRETVAPADVPAPASIGTALRAMMRSPHLASRRWIWEQYDHMVMGDTVVRPGSDAGVVRVHGTNKGLAITTDVTPRYCEADPVEGGKQAVAEAWRNLIATGADPLAVTDCMNFGNPERPEIMGQFVGCIEGMGAACSALDMPVVSGNVSLYNETSGIAIPPTPAIGAVGLIPDLTRTGRMSTLAEGNRLWLIGAPGSHLGQSIYQDVVAEGFAGAPPSVDLATERSIGDRVRNDIRKGRLTAVHDVSDGGLLVAIAEMLLASGLGADLTTCDVVGPAHAFWFGEDQARFVVATAATTELEDARALGIVGGNSIILTDGEQIPLCQLRTLHEDWLPGLMG
ncbi:MAG: phosphoribosylformylglycinamidine synthase subunit PurL [Pseudomonadota bacterium]